MLNLTVDFWKTSMDIQAYITHNKMGNPRNLSMTFDTGVYMTSIDTSALSRARYSVDTGKVAYIDADMCVVY